MRLPKGVQEAAAQQAEKQGRAAPGVPERGPEITEIR
jgi:hypothetical protein